MSSFKKNTEYEILTPTGWSDFKGINKITKDEYIKIKFSNNIELVCSKNHKIKLKCGTFEYAKNLNIGTDILSKNEILSIIEIINIKEKIDLYDVIFVDKNSEFYSNDVISHNCAHIDDIEEIWGSAQPTLSGGGKAILLSCVVKGTYILTNSGFSRIENFIPNNGMPGDYSIPEYKIFGKDSFKSGELFHNNGIVKTKKIKTKFSEFEGSYNHKVLAYKKSSDEYIWPLQINELKIGDYICIRKNTQIFGNDDSINVKYCNSKKIKNPIRYNSINKDLAYLFGLYISEGNGNRVKCKNNSFVGGNLTITCGDNISWVFDELNLNYYCADNMHYSISSKNLIELFESVGFDLSRKAHNKIIPDKLLKMSKDNIIYMLRGLFDGDGCSSNKTISYSSTSEELIDQIRMILLNMGIMCSKFRKDKDSGKPNKIKHNYDCFNLEIYGKNAQRFYNIVGFNLERKQNNIKKLNSCNFERHTSRDVIPNSADLVKKLYMVSGENTGTIRRNFGLNINGLVNKHRKYKTKNVSREIVIKMFELFSHLLPENEYNRWKDYISWDLVWTEIKEITESENDTYDFSLPEIKNDVWCHSILYNGIIGHQTPAGVGNFFHKTWVDAKAGKNSFNTIQLHWSMHPERDDDWRARQDELLGPRLAAQECDASFLSSGKNVVPPETIDWYKITFMQAPKEKREYFGNQLWIWERCDMHKQYIVSADTARGDSEDCSAAQVFDIVSMTQVAEFHGLVGTTDFANILITLATEYNDALLVIENGGLGWSTVQAVIDRDYKNLFYTMGDLKYVDPNNQYINKLYSKDKKAVAGFTTSMTTRPLIIKKLENYFTERSILIRSERLLNELMTFTWNGNKAMAMSGFNDDLVLSLAFAMWVRDTALQISQNNLNITVENLKAFQVNRPDMQDFGNSVITSTLTPEQTWLMSTGMTGEVENLTDYLGADCKKHIDEKNEKTVNSGIIYGKRTQWD